MLRRSTTVFTSRHQPVLGTVLDLRVGARSQREAARVERSVVAEIDRLEALLSAFRPNSEFCRWRVDPEFAPGPELATVLREALEWQQRSGGVFNPAVGLLTDRWRLAEATGVIPSTDEMATLAASIAEPRFTTVGERIEHLADCTALNFNAFAKGWIVDAAAQHAMAIGRVASVMVNIGGDLVQRGDADCRVGIEDPRGRVDNRPPLARVLIRDRALATSGSARRGFNVAGTWLSHVIDPRTGWPVESVPSVSVLADRAATADVMATVLAVLGVDDGLRFVEACAAFTPACFVRPDGTLVTSSDWPAPQSGTRPV